MLVYVYGYVYGSVRFEASVGTRSVAFMAPAERGPTEDYAMKELLHLNLNLNLNA